MTNLKKQLLIVHKLIAQLLWNLLESFLGPKRLLKAQKKTNFPVKKGFWLISSRIIEHEKRQGTIYKRPPGIFDNYCTNDNNISMGPKRSTETNISKNSSFHDDKSFWPIFPRIIGCVKPQRTYYKCPHAFLTITLEPIGAFLVPKGLLKTQIFSGIIEHDKGRETIYEGPPAIWTNIVQLLRTFLWDLTGR